MVQLIGMLCPQLNVGIAPPLTRLLPLPYPVLLEVCLQANLYVSEVSRLTLDA